MGRGIEVGVFYFLKSESLPNLTSFRCHISQKGNIAALDRMAEKCFNLKSLSIASESYSYGLDQRNIFNLVNLTDLHLSSWSLSDVYLRLFEGLKELVQLSLRYIVCSSIESEVIFGRALSRTSLKHLKIESLTDENLQCVFTILNENHQLQWLEVELWTNRAKHKPHDGSDPPLLAPLISKCSEGNPSNYSLRYNGILHTNY